MVDQFITIFTVIVFRVFSCMTVILVAPVVLFREMYMKTVMDHTSFVEWEENFRAQIRARIEGTT